MQNTPAAQAVRQVVVASLERLQYLVIRFGVASLPADLFLNCDDIVLTVLALRM